LQAAYFFTTGTMNTKTPKTPNTPSPSITPRPLRTYQVFFLTLGAFCALAIAVNLVVRRVPVHDATIESDLSSIASAIDSYASTQSVAAPTLPANLSQLTEISDTTKRRLSQYEYHPRSISQYELCATFLATGQRRNVGKPYSASYADTTNHVKGRECFTYRVTSSYPAPGRQ
jgi:hypothetical protein